MSGYLEEYMRNSTLYLFYQVPVRRKAVGLTVVMFLFFHGLFWRRD